MSGKLHPWKLNNIALQTKPKNNSDDLTMYEGNIKGAQPLDKELQGIDDWQEREN